MDILLLIDASSYLYRAFHAMPKLKNSNNEPTGAILGVIKMLQKLLSQYNPKYVACVFDSHNSNNVRKKIFPQYKEHRKKMPDELIIQLDNIKEIISYLGLPIIISNEVESDDVIGTLAYMAKKENLNTVISTGDKDLAQLVSNNITIVNTMNNEILDEKFVLKKFGVSPNMIVEFLMLVGDNSDNIPGVNNIGPKTAIKLLNTYGSLDGIIKSLDTIKSSISENIRKSIPFFPIARSLITIQTNCYIKDQIKSFDDFLVKQPNYEKLKNKYQELNFDILLKDINKHNFQQNLLSKEKFEFFKFQIIENWDDFVIFFEKISNAKYVALHFITTSLDFMKSKISNISICIDNNLIYHICFERDNNSKFLLKNEVLNYMASWLSDKNKKKILYDAKNILHLLANEGISIDGYEDIMIQSYILDTHSSIKIKDLSRKFLRYNLLFSDINKQIHHEKKYEKFSDINHIYNSIENVNIYYQLFMIFNQIIQTNTKLLKIYNLELSISLILFNIERYGVCIDRNELQLQNNYINSKISSIEKNIFNIVGYDFNLNSPKQISEILFTKLKLPIIKKTQSGQPSTNEDVLKKLSIQYDLPKYLLEHRSLNKIKSTYTSNLPKMINECTGKLHTHYSQVSVITGRLSSSNPNLQNIPNRIGIGKNVRKAFIPEKNILISADYSQIELRIMSYLSGDINLQDAFFNNQDIHTVTASEIFHIPLKNVNNNQRQAAKSINFGLIYGMSAFGLSVALNISKIEANEYIKKYFNKYPKVLEYMNNICLFAHENGYIETIFGRKLLIPDINNKSIISQKTAERLAINAPIQGTASDIIKIAMIKLNDWISNKKLSSKIIMQVHDELLLDVEKNEIDDILFNLPDIMCKIQDCDIPLKINIGKGYNWHDAH
ncbi:DNA polymerase I [Candidatus Kinetoplastibacterium sorsogonicusi]|uniref:DNA polymerase I n=1 Tax=Candidatus Kinetoplastidibacterium kentomonadis TaxID=1576550 RepID=A0A3S7JA10_9PROT|nr:DNA polymerase I [Candidatus Kinetoplastibacterium sorsogonicusi]AWD32508.1 DNA polymerase I [Candidatus Kinetoplastibacterium sorsogonicusi]